MMELPAVVPVKFKRRRVSSVRDWPAGCGPLALPVAPRSTAPPPSESDPKPSQSEEISTPGALSGLSASPPPGAAGVEAAPSSTVEESVVSLKVAKPEPVESVAEAVKPVDAEWSKGSGAPGPETKEVGKGIEGFPGELVKLELLELPDGSLDQPKPADALKIDEVARKRNHVRKYPQPKRRRILAVRDFPIGCGRNVPRMSSEESSEAAPIIAYLKSKSLDVEEKPVMSQQQVVEGSAGITHTEEAAIDGKTGIAKELEGISHEAQLKPASAPFSSKSLGGGEKPVAELASTEKVRGEVKRTDEKEIREKAQEISDKARVESASTGSQIANSTDEHSENKMLMGSTSEKKLEGCDMKQISGNLPIQEEQESRLSLDKIPQSGSKASDKDGSIPVRKLVIKGPTRPQADAKILKRMFLEEECIANDRTEVGFASEACDSRLIVQAPMAALNSPWRHSRKSRVFISGYYMQKDVKKKEKSWSKNISFKGMFSSPIKKDMATEDAVDSLPLDEEYEKALAVFQEPCELSVNVTPLVPPKLNYEIGDNDEISDRMKVKRALRLFQMYCRRLLQGDHGELKGLGPRNRVDLAASNILKENKEWVNTGKPIFGNVPGIEVGDEFHYRVELSIVGLHHPYQGGIDSVKKDGVPLATSIVSSGGYPDDMDSSDVLIYTGAGGNLAGGGKQPEDQKLERGNLALKNSIHAKTPVRVIYGFKDKESKHDARARIVSTFTYDGLYIVESYNTVKGPHGFSVFKFQLRRMAGQPELALKEVKRSKKAKVREGLCIKDVSEGKESMPICAVNTIDGDRPMPFKYTTKNIYPSWHIQTPPRGCNCTDRCLDSKKCACAGKNGGEIPFNYDGAIVRAKPLVYECGPSCKCPPSCYNRVSQHGIKISLEIFKTRSRGWGVRSLYSIPSGTFICEYIGELLKDLEAEYRSNDEYLFDIGHNYEDKSLWEGLPSSIPGLESSFPCETVEDAGFTIDAAEYGNVGRFINHSCSPNLYAQNVLYDHDDKRMPHIMLFAADNIPPLKELTYHYNYTVDQVHDAQGNIKRKNCYCGSLECTGRLY